MVSASPVDVKKSIDYASLKDRNVLITGGVSGLGKSMVEMFANNGANIVVGDVQEGLGATLEQNLSSKAKIKFVRVDVSSFESQVAFLRTALDFFPRHEVDIFVPCAGLLGMPTQVSPADPSELANLKEPSADLTGRIISVNLTAVFVGTLLVARYGMGLHSNPKPEPTKSIVLIASLAGYCGAEGSVEYTTTKFGVRGLLRGLRKQLAGMNVRLNAVAPFYVETPMTAHAVPVLKQLGIPIAPADLVTEAVARLATDETAFGEERPSITWKPVTNTQLGRSVFVMPEGLSDGGDDSKGNHGGDSFSTKNFGQHWAVLVNGPMSDDIPSE